MKETKLTQLYNRPWVDDGTPMTEAARARLTAICGAYAEEYLEASQTEVSV